MTTAIASATFLSELQRVAGAGAVRYRTEGGAGAGGQDALASWAVAGVVPAAVVEPADAAGVAAVLALCSDAGVPVEAAGGGTWLAAGAVPPAPPVVVSTRRLRAVLEYEPADLVAGIQAGVTHADLARELGAHGQMLPLDPPARDGATVGATFALAAAGPLRAAYGTPRDMILGVEIVTADGRLFQFGGRVVKNVAGYDIVRLATGSRGSLGIITALYVLLRSAPAVDRTLTISVGPSAADAAAAALAIRGRTECDALELLAPALAAELVGEAAAGRDGWLLAVRVRGSDAAVADVTDRIVALQPTARTLPESAAASLWRGLSASEAEAAVALRLGDAPAALGGTLERALGLVAAGSGRVAAGPVSSGAGASGEAAVGGAAGGWRIAAHAASGIVRLWLPPGRVELDEAAWAAALDGTGADHLRRGGSLHWAVLPPGLAGLRRDPAPADAAAAALMQGIARTFDPAGIMAPGRRGYGP